MRLTVVRFLQVWALLLITSAGPALAQGYPVKSVRIIVPFAAGGPADNYARFIAQRLGDALGQPFVVDNRPGAGSLIGTDLLLVARPSLPVKNLQDVLRLAKEQPGKLNYASSGPGTPYHMAGELLKSMAGIYLVHIPYRGSSGARTDVIGGQVDLMFDAVTTMAEQARAGKVRAIATSGRQRSEVMPDVPTLNEAGVPDYEATIWLGLMAPRGTPATVVNRLNEEIRKIVSQAEVRQLWVKQGATPLLMSPEAFDKYLREDITKWARVIQSAGIKAD